MTDVLALALIFLAILNPVSGLLLSEVMARYTSQSSPGRDTALAGLISLALLVIAAVFGESLIDWLEITPPTFQIATGVLLVVGVLMVFAPMRPHDNPGSAGDEGGIWPIVRMILWLASPAALAAALSYRIEFGLGSTLTGIVLAMAVSAAILARGRDILNRVPVSIMTWLGRFIGAVVVVIAVDLIRRGVENV